MKIGSVVHKLWSEYMAINGGNTKNMNILNHNSKNIDNLRLWSFFHLKRLAVTRVTGNFGVSLHNYLFIFYPTPNTRTHSSKLFTKYTKKTHNSKLFTTQYDAAWNINSLRCRGNFISRLESNKL